MKMILKPTLYLFCFFIFIQYGNAKDQRPGTNLNFDQLKESCVDFAKYGYQRPPTNIIIFCKHAMYHWQKIEPSVLPLKTKRKQTSSIQTDKNHISEEDDDIISPDLNFYCPNFNEVLDTLNLELQTSCHEIVNFKGDLRSFCYLRIERELSENPQVVQRKNTGRTLSSCKTKILTTR